MITVVEPPLWLSQGKRLRIGDRVVSSETGKKQHIVQSRVNAGTIVKTDGIRPGGGVNYVTVQWDAYKRPHSYAVCFIDKLKKTKRGATP